MITFTLEWYHILVLCSFVVTLVLLKLMERKARGRR